MQKNISDHMTWPDESLLNYSPVLWYMGIEPGEYFFNLPKKQENLLHHHTAYNSHTVLVKSCSFT